MLAAISPPSHNLVQSMPYARSPTTSGPLLPDSVSPAENKICPGCQLTVMDENGGVVIAFGQSFFHVDCFKCAKCRDRVTADTNLLLLSDGQPVCSNCSYSCSVCHQPILDEAIMTGDDSYHAHCFKCRTCHNRIDELMFAKTSHGIYCMKCHHQRVARSRRHAQKQKERENTADAGSSSTSQGRPTKLQSGPSVNGPTGLLTPGSSANSHSTSCTSSAQSSPALPQSMTPLDNGDNYRSQPQTPQGGRPSAHLNGDDRRGAPHSPSAPARTPHRTSRTTLPSPTSPSAISPQVGSSAPRMYPSDPSSPAIVLPPEIPEAGPQGALSYVQHEPSSDSGSTTPFLTPDASTSLERRTSYDDGTRPLNVLSKNGALPPNSSLSVRQPNNRAGKRNSINPGMTFDYEAVTAEINSKSISAPQSPLSFLPLASDVALTSAPGDAQRLPQRDQASGVSRRPSRKGHAETPASAPATGGSMLHRQRSRTEGSSKPASSVEPMGPSPSLIPRHNMMLEHLPPRTHSLTASSQDPELMNPRPPTSASTHGSSPRRSASDGKDRPKPGSSLSIDVEKSRTDNGVGNNRPRSPAYKAASPAHKVDVPRGIESGTDTSDGERGPSTKGRTRKSSLPSKDKEAKSRRRPVQLELDTKQSSSQEEPGETSFLSSAGDADSEDESSPVERVSRSTFIAPAHPPIRFSVSGNGFQELLSQVDPRNRSSLYAIEQLVKMSQDAEAHLSASQSAASSNLNGSARQTEGMHLSTLTSAVTPATASSSSSSWTADNSSVTTISAPSSQGHDDSFVMLDQLGTAKGAESKLHPHQRSMNNALLSSSSRSSLERSSDSSAKDHQRTSVDTTAAVYHSNTSLSEPSPHLTVTAPDSSVTRLAKLDPSYAVTKRLQDALQDAVRRGMPQITLDQEFVQTVAMMIDQRRDENAVTKGRVEHNKSASQPAMGGLIVAYGEYDAEQKARREAEAEVTRLRVLLSGQAARITALSSQGRRDELHRQLSLNLRDTLSGLGQDVAKLKAERDVALVEIEEIAASKSSGLATDRDGAGLSRSLSTRLGHLKSKYKGELMSLTDERESLLREIAELRSAREIFLEETTMLNARNEELAQLNAYYVRRIEAASSELPTPAREKQLSERQHPALPLQPSHSVHSSFATSSDESADYNKYVKSQQKPTTGVFKRRGNHKESTTSFASATQDGPIEKPRLKHTFQHVNVLRLLKCDHCGDKLWGSQARCQVCHISIHPRCQPNVLVVCLPQTSRREEGPAGVLQPAMFGRELTEQVRADSKFNEKMVPLIVEKCIAAVEGSALDYEGIYRKNGGAAQSKLITQLFERGDYSAFDLLDLERFNDIGSVTSVLKSYFRSLPNPLLTFALHDEFIYASSIQDPVIKCAKYADLVKQLPTEHYYTLRTLMYHLHRIQEHNETNLMTARNLGVVFGPTLMRPRNPGAEFADMAGKALTIEWLVENAPKIFPPLSTSH